MSKIKSKPKRPNIKGILLIEVLITISICAILSFVALIGVGKQLTKARDADVKVDLIALRSALDQYYDDNGCYPEKLPDCGVPFKSGENVYIAKFPCLENDEQYIYENSGTPHDSRLGKKQETGCFSWYKVLVNLRDTNDRSIDLIGCRRGCGSECRYNFGISSSNMPINDKCPQYDSYACTPSGYCVEYTDPTASDCPRVFRDDPTCQNLCRVNDNRCKNEKGKKPQG